MVDVRPATAADVGTVATIYLSSRAAAGDQFPPGIHPPDDVRGFVRDVVIPTRQTWLAVDPGASGKAGRPVGILVLDGADLDWLFVAPPAWGRGVGTVLLDHAIALRPGGLALWAFAANTRARGFYERRGFRAVRTTEGDNEEGAPDVRYVWGDHLEGHLPGGDHPPG